MGKKKKAVKVWCYYCEREFEDEKILIQHQKAKHFKCHVCHKKLSTAGGMVVHVLQVHKESVTKVPNSKPEREATELEIFGMEGIPPEILATRDGGQGGAMDDDERPAKIARVEVPLPSVFGGLVNMRSNVNMATQPFSYAGAMPPIYVPPAGGPRSSSWPMPPASQGRDLLMHPRPHPLPVQPPSQPLFPIQSSSPSPISSVTSSLSSVQPLFPIGLSRPPSSGPRLQVHQPQSSFLGNGLRSVPLPTGQYSSLLPGRDAFSPNVLPPSRDSAEDQSAVDSLSVRSSLPFSSGGQNSSSPTRRTIPSSLEVVTPVPSLASHMYASAPSTSGPSIGPPPVISNQPPVPPGMANEVYLVWDDEVLSMEERRLSLPQYHVLDATQQVFEKSSGLLFASHMERGKPRFCTV